MTEVSIKLELERVIVDPSQRSSLADVLLTMKNRKVSRYQSAASGTTLAEDKFFFGNLDCLDELIDLLTTKSDSDLAEMNSESDVLL
jgi:hypothetical protein